MGKIPKYIVIALNTNTALAEKLTESAFYFDHHNLKTASVHWTGDQTETRTIPLNFSTASNTLADDYLLGLNSLAKVMKQEAGWNGITREKYKQGMTFVAFELLPSIPNTLAVNRRGSLKITLEFGATNNPELTALVYCVYSSVLEIDADRQVTLE